MRCNDSDLLPDGFCRAAAAPGKTPGQKLTSRHSYQDCLPYPSLTHAGAAAILGRCRRQIENYLSGDEPIPRVVTLACYGYVGRRQGIRDLLLPTQTQVAEIPEVTGSRGTSDTLVKFENSIRQASPELTSAI